MICCQLNTQKAQNNATAKTKTKRKNKGNLSAGVLLTPTYKKRAKTQNKELQYVTEYIQENEI